MGKTLLHPGSGNEKDKGLCHIWTSTGNIEWHGVINQDVGRIGTEEVGGALKVL